MIFAHSPNIEVKKSHLQSPDFYFLSSILLVNFSKSPMSTKINFNSWKKIGLLRSLFSSLPADICKFLYCWCEYLIVQTSVTEGHNLGENSLDIFKAY